MKDINQILRLLIFRKLTCSLNLVPLNELNSRKAFKKPHERKSDIISLLSWLFEQLKVELDASCFYCLHRRANQLAAKICNYFHSSLDSYFPFNKGPSANQESIHQSQQLQKCCFEVSKWFRSQMEITSFVNFLRSRKSKRCLQNMSCHEFHIIQKWKCCFKRLWWFLEDPWKRKAFFTFTRFSEGNRTTEKKVFSVACTARCIAADS